MASGAPATTSAKMLVVLHFGQLFLFILAVSKNSSSAFIFYLLLSFPRLPLLFVVSPPSPPSPPFIKTSKGEFRWEGEKKIDKKKFDPSNLKRQIIEASRLDFVFFFLDLKFPSNPPLPPKSKFFIARGES